jgi:hypothetical protein
MNEKTNKITLNITSETEMKCSLAENKYVNEVFNQYNINNYKKYAHLELLAIDKLCGGGKKVYLGFKNKSDKVKFIKSYKYNNLYEILINDIVKPYFDIDYKKEDEHKSDDEVKLILNGFITEFNKFFRLPITSDNLYVYAKRDDETEKIKSIHIVVSDFSTTKKALKDCVKKINQQRKPTSFKALVGGFDGSVYNTRKLFSMPHQRKLGKSEYFDWFYCFDNDKNKYGDGAIFKYLINDVGNCVFNDYCNNTEEESTIIENKIIMEEKLKEKEENIIIKDGMIKLNPSNIVDTLLEHLPQKFYDSGGWQHISRQIVMNKFNGYQKWLDESVKKSPQYKIEQNKEWANKLDDKYATLNLTKHLNFLNNEFDLCFIWDRSNYFTKELMSWICKISKTTQIELTATIKRTTEENQKQKKQMDKIMVGNNYTFNLKNQTLINDILQTINHFGMETKFNNQYGIINTEPNIQDDNDESIFKTTTQTDKIESKFETITQDKIESTMINYLKDTKDKLSGWQMKWGCGKSYHGLATIVKWAETNNKRILALTHLNTLNSEMTTSMENNRTSNGKNAVISHSDLDDKNKCKNICNAPIIVSSLESLGTVLKYNKNVPIDIIVFDESESIENAFISTTFKKFSAFEVSEMVRKLVRDAKKVVCMDCDLSRERMNIIHNILIDDEKDNTKMALYKCDHNSWKDYKYIIHTQKPHMNKAMINDIFINGKRILYPTNAKTDGKSIYKLIKLNAKIYKKPKNIMIVSADGIEYIKDGTEYTESIVKEWKNDLKFLPLDNEELISYKTKIDIGKYAKTDKKIVFVDFETAVKDLKIEILIYSPSITCGISFGNHKTEFMFDKLYGYATKGSITAREYLQMLHRCRNLKDSEINLHIKNGLMPVSPLIDNSMVEPLILNHQHLKFCDDDDKWWNGLDFTKYQTTKLFKEILTSCVKEKINSERNYAQELLGKLKINHGMNVLIKHIFHESNEEKDISVKQINDDYLCIKKVIKVDTIMLLQLEPKITQTHFEYISNQLNENDGTDNRNKKNKYFLLDILRINKPHSNSILGKEIKNDIEKQRDGYWCRYNKNTKDEKIVWHLKSELMGYTDGIFKNYSTDADGDVCFYNEHILNKYYIEEDDNKQDGYWCHYVNKNDIVVGKIWKLKIELFGVKNGTFIQHIFKTDNKRYYYGGDYKSFKKSILDVNEIDELQNKADNYDDYFDITEIQYEPYDKDKLIQHSKKLAEIYNSPSTDRLNKLNSAEINTDKKKSKPKNKDGTVNTNEFKIADFGKNKLIVVKKVINMIGIDIHDLIYNRKILSNSELKKLLQDNSLFIEEKLIKFYNDNLMIGTKPLSCAVNITKYDSENDKHFKYVKEIIILYFAFIGITHNHYNKDGNRGKYVNKNNDVLNIFQYELCDYKHTGIKFINGVKTEYNYYRTFINTYYTTLKNELYVYYNKTKRTIDYVLDKKALDENMMAKKIYKRLDKKFEMRQKAIFKRNRYIKYHCLVEDDEKFVKIPFNLMTADGIYDNQNNRTSLKNTTKEQRIELWLKIYLLGTANHLYESWREIYKNNPNTILKYDTTGLKSTKKDTHYYGYKEISWGKKNWKDTDELWKKTQVVKYTSDKNKIDNIIEIKNHIKNPTTEEQVNDVLNDIIDEIAVKDDFKTMVGDDIQIGGETDTIQRDYGKLLCEEIDTAIPNAHDTHFNIMRPNIKNLIKTIDS